MFLQNLVGADSPDFGEILLKLRDSVTISILDFIIFNQGLLEIWKSNDIFCFHRANYDKPHHKPVIGVQRVQEMVCTINHCTFRKLRPSTDQQESGDADTLLNSSLHPSCSTHPACQRNRSTQTLQSEPVTTQTVSYLFNVDVLFCTRLKQVDSHLLSKLLRVSRLDHLRVRVVVLVSHWKQKDIARMTQQENSWVNTKRESIFKLRKPWGLI